MKPKPHYPQGMNQAVVATPVGLPIPDRTRAAGADIFGAHQGPLTVTDDFAVLDDPVEQREFTETFEADGRTTAESVLMVQGMYCAACAD
ncbi:MAG: hypothetical protein WEK74_06095, partial [Hydrogenophaga sp.]